MNLETYLKKRLQDGGWEMARLNGKHTVWQHPNGSIYILPHRMSDTGHRRINALKAIQKLEEK